MAHAGVHTTFSGSRNQGLQVGYNTGNIETHHHYPTERPETPPSPSSTVPFRRDLDFVERGELFDQINQKCAVPGSWTALVGLGGVGKSQLAIEYAYRTRERSRETWVFWVHASNAARFEQSYRDIADKVKILGRRDPKANIFKLVYNWLRDDKNGKWVLILDNVDDARFLLDAQLDIQSQASNSESRASKPLREYLPQSQNGSILITSRSREAALQLVEEIDVIAVEPMDKAHALALFEKKMGKQGEIQDVAELAAALEFIPLAISQAAAYISQRGPRCSVQQYLEEFQKSDRKKTSLLNHEAGQLRRDREAKNSIIITWQISFDYILQTRPSAADLLSLMSFFDRQGIPEALLRIPTEQQNAQQNQSARSRNDNADDDEDSESQPSVSDEFEDDVQALRNYSFIVVNMDTTTFEMHRLVQLATQKWLAAYGQLEKWKQQYIKNLCAEFPTGDFENWAKCQALFSHAKSAAAQRPEKRDSLLEWASVLHRAAWYAWSKGNGAEAERMSVKAMNTRKKLVGQEHIETLKSMEMVALIYRLEGQWDMAEELFVQVTETMKRVLGAEHPDALTSMSNLATTYSDQGRWKDAEELEMRVMETRKRVLGAEHLDALTSMNNLALTYKNQGRWKEAEELQIQVMETRKRVLGAEHPDTLTSMNNLALTYRKQGRWNEAEELQVRVVETRKRVLGAEHPSTLSSMNNLASTYWNQGRWNEAEELEVRVMETRKRVLGAEHPDTLTSISNLATTYSDQGRWKEAEELEVGVMETRKRVLGAEHPSTLTSMKNLAVTYSDQGRWKEAEELEVLVVETRKRVLGAEHPSTLSSMNNLASTYSYQGRWKEAEELEVGVMETRKRVLGAEHPSTLSSMNNLASTYLDQGRWNEAEELEMQVMETRKRELGAEHPDTLTSMANLAFTWTERGRVAEAIELMKKCVQLQTQILGADHPDTLSSSEDLIKWETENLMVD